jgi:hypothetical protein
MPGKKDHWQWFLLGRDTILKLEAVQPRHLKIDHQATRGIRAPSAMQQEVLGGVKRNDLEPRCP